MKKCHYCGEKNEQVGSEIFQLRGDLEPATRHSGVMLE